MYVAPSQRHPRLSAVHFSSSSSAACRRSKLCQQTFSNGATSVPKSVFIRRRILKTIPFVSVSFIGTFLIGKIGIAFTVPFRRVTRQKLEDFKPGKWQRIWWVLQKLNRYITCKCNCKKYSTLVSRLHSSNCLPRMGTTKYLNGILNKMWSIRFLHST